MAKSAVITAPAPAPDELTEAMAGELRRMIVRCPTCGPAVMCDPCHTADRILARWDGSVRDPFPAGSVVRLIGRRGRFTVKHLHPNGTADLWGGTPGREKSRTVNTDQLRAAE